MKIWRKMLAFFFGLFVLSDSPKKQNSLRMVLVLFRHGEKNPTSFYPTDPHRELNWSGVGTLTQRGSLQAYQLGVNLHIRYHQLLPENGIYTPKNMLVFSSETERCIMSAQSVCASFVRPLAQNNFLPIPWQPVPVKSIPREQDTILAQKKVCSKYDSQLQNLYRTPPPDLQLLNEQNAELFDFLSNQTGKNISNILDVELLYNTLKSEKEMGFILPDWSENIYPDAMRTLAERSYILFTETDFMKKVKGGAFLREVINNMEAKNERKIYFYSGHDVTIVNVLNSLGIVNQTDKLPQFSSALAFELHENPLLNDTLEVKISYYHNSRTIQPIDVVIPKCTTPCSLIQFKESIRPLLFDDYNKLCEN